jgi:uncharacterized membrane protein
MSEAPARFTLGITALAFVVIGVGFIVFPVSWAQSVEILLPTAMARTDLRATYGGFDLGFGLFLAACAHRPAWHAPGLYAAAIALGGFGLTRLAGHFLDGPLDPFMWKLLAVELPVAALCTWLYRRQPR